MARDAVSRSKTTALPRRLNCERCGKSFECSLGGGCWCAAETFRLPLPADGDCLCPDCLRKAAVARHHTT
jgi:hypothetical protein